MNSYLSSIPTAFDGTDPNTFGTIPFIANVCGRIGYAVITDILASNYEKIGATYGSLWINLCYMLFFGSLLLIVFTGDGTPWFLYLILAFGYSTYGGGVCVASSFVKFSFPADRIGFILGCLYTFAAFANLFFSHMFPPGNREQNKGVERVPLDFVPPWVAAFVVALCTLP